MKFQSAVVARFNSLGNQTSFAARLQSFGAPSPDRSTFQALQVSNASWPRNCARRRCGAVLTGANENLPLVRYIESIYRNAVDERDGTEPGKGANGD
ncbi:MAG TPA: hypothetical protein VMV15_05540 [Candidatus Binataceae bacterium]|nr:hypothetical protein [Candidatus Binataceae bacterium]